MAHKRRISDHTKYRLLEIIPGALVWGTLILAVVFSFAKPLWVIYFIIVFDFYWLVKVMYLLFYLFVSFSRYRGTIKVDWLKKIQNLPEYKKIHHVVMLPTYNESGVVINGTLEGLARVKYDRKKIIIVYAIEERNKEYSLPLAEKMQHKYRDLFEKFLITVHPANIPGEVKGKGANIHHAGKETQKLLDEMGLDYKNVILSSFDIDTVVHPQYFAYLTDIF